MTPTVQEAALSLIDKGFSVIPCNTDKRPALKTWKPYMDRQMTAEEAGRFFKNGEALGVVCGAVSGNLSCIDFDKPELFSPFLETLEDIKPDLAEKLVKRQTPSGGYHIIYRCEGPVQGNLKLAMSPDGKDTLIETRGEGGYFLTAPSPGYSVIKHSLMAAPILKTDEVELLHGIASSFNEYADPHRKKEQHVEIDGTRPGDVFNERTDTRELLESNGWTTTGRTGPGGEHWTRPGKERGTSATLKDGCLYVFSSNAGLPTGPHTSFSIYAHLNHGGDFSAAAKELYSEGFRQITERIEKAESKRGAKPRVNIVNALDFMSMTFPPRENILSPWLPAQGLAMIYAPRGIGKTHLSLGIAYAVASAGQLYHWQAPRPRGVLFIDGEMPAVVLQERLARIAVSSGSEPQAPLHILTPDLQQDGMLDLSRPEDQAEIEQHLEGVSLLILDNISTLCRSGRENEAESWQPVQEWALRQRAAGRSVLFIHHSGKGGQQRGTSRREDVLDTVIALRYPGDYSPDQGATFEVHFEKSRGIYGEDTKPFEAKLTTTPEGDQVWTTKNLEQSTAEKVAKLLNDGIPQKEISDMLVISKGAVSKAKKRAEGMGLIT